MANDKNCRHVWKLMKQIPFNPLCRFGLGLITSIWSFDAVNRKVSYETGVYVTKVCAGTAICSTEKLRYDC
jgi:hypothetical protein